MSTTPKFDFNAKSTLSWYDTQIAQIYASIFGFLCFWGAQNIYASGMAYRKRQKLIYLLNFLQTLFLFIKTVSATIYATYYNLDCAPRGPLVNIPLILAWDAIYLIILLKLLIFTTWPRLAIGIFGLGLATHIAVVIAGLVLRTSSMSASWTCRDVYPLVYKQQYVVELIIEIFAILFLVQGLASKQQGGLFDTTKAILTQLRNNEHIRVFLVLIFISIKIALSYSNPPFDTRALTHFIDSCRSGLVCWAILREQKTVAKAVTRSRQNSSRPFGSTSVTASIQKKSVRQEADILSSFGPIEEETQEWSVNHGQDSVVVVDPIQEPMMQSDDTVNRDD